MPTAFAQVRNPQRHNESLLDQDPFIKPKMTIYHYWRRMLDFVGLWSDYRASS
jgi:hypothetical protein